MRPYKIYVSPEAEEHNGLMRYAWEVNQYYSNSNFSGYMLKGFGYSVTAEDAFKDAYNEYMKIKYNNESEKLQSEK